MAVVSKLEDENRRLRDQLTRNNDSHHNKHNIPAPTGTVSITREELQCIKNLTEENIKSKRLLKSKEKELTQKTIDMEAVSKQNKKPISMGFIVLFPFSISPLQGRVHPIESIQRLDFLND